MLINKINEVYLELTDKCLLECRHCSSSAWHTERNYLTLEKINDILLQAKEMGANYFAISGGEPLLYKKLWEVLKIAKDLNYKTTIYSCGIVKNEKKLASISEETLFKIKDNNVDRMIFSLHGANAGTHDYITDEKGSYNLTIKSIQRTVKTGITTEIHTVPMSINYKEIPKLVDIAEELKVKSVSLLRLVPQGRCTQNIDLMMNREQTKYFFKLVSKINAKTLTLRKGSPYKCIFMDKSKSCSAGKDKVLIGPDGSVHPCEAFKSDVSTSNVNNNYLKDIWHNDDMLNKLRNLSLDDIEVCNSCSNLQKCNGGCPGQRWLKYNNMLIGPDPICLI